MRNFNNTGIPQSWTTLLVTFDGILHLDTYELILHLHLAHLLATHLLQPGYQLLSTLDIKLFSLLFLVMNNIQLLIANLLLIRLVQLMSLKSIVHHFVTCAQNAVLAESGLFWEVVGVCLKIHFYYLDQVVYLFLSQWLCFHMLYPWRFSVCCHSIMIVSLHIHV